MWAWRHWFDYWWEAAVEQPAGRRERFWYWLELRTPVRWRRLGRWFGYRGDRLMVDRKMASKVEPRG